MADAVEDLTCCPVCFEEYEETGDRVPRILPCHHTLCEKCAGQILRKKSLVCPECRIKHPATGGILTFPQNKYIVANIRRKPVVIVDYNEPKVTENFSKCKEHGKEASLYCYGKKCQKAICQLCLLKRHKTHDVVDINEELKGKGEVLVEHLETVKSALQAKKNKMLAAKKEIKKKNKTCVADLQTRKEEHLRIIEERYDKLIKDANDEVKKVSSDIEDEFATLNKDIELLDKIKHKTDANMLTGDGMEKGFQTVRAIAVNSVLNFCGSLRYKYNEYQEDKITTDEVDKFCGNLVPCTKHVDLYDQKDAALQKISEEVPEPPDRPLLTRFLQKIFSGQEGKNPNLAQLNCKVIRSIITKCSDIYHMVPVGDNSVIVCGKVANHYKLMEYNLQTGVESRSTTLNERPSGMTETKLDEKSYFALCYKDENEIELRDANNPKYVSRKYSIAQNPFNISSTSSAIFYVDVSKNPREIVWLDCSASPPKQSNITHTRLKWIRDMCYIQHEGKQLLVTTRDENGINAYDTTRNKLEWSAKGNLPGMKWRMNASSLTTDGRGHIFVCDTNNCCIQMFSTEGLYLGCLLREGEQELSTPINVRWCDSMSSLIIAHDKGSEYHVSIIYLA